MVRALPSLRVLGPSVLRPADTELCLIFLPAFDRGQTKGTEGLTTACSAATAGVMGPAERLQTEGDWRALVFMGGSIQDNERDTRHEGDSAPACVHGPSAGGWLLPYSRVRGGFCGHTAGV